MVIDGTTATTVVVNPNGSVTVGVANTTSNGVSLNKYKAFNVPTPGLELDNRAVAARTIVNEVTGPTKSNINGKVEVLGQRAHVIIANPNGIVIDGGRFVNTGRVALTTGTIAINPQQIAPGIFQNNVVANVSGGVISITGAGLSGQMDALDLIANLIKIDGPVSNTSANENASLRLIAGQNSVEFDSSILPGNTSLSWGTVTGAGATSAGALLVELTANGVLRSNRIGIEVSDKGAGVRIAGEGYATSRQFTLQSDGHIALNTSKITGKQGLLISGASVALDSAEIASSDGVLSIGAHDGAGAGITGGKTTLTGTDIFLTSAADLSLGTATEGATLTTQTGDIAANVSGRFTDLSGVFTSGRNIIVSATKGLSFTKSTLKADQTIQLETKGTLETKTANISAAGHVLLTADAAHFDRDGDTSEIIAESGALIVTTTGKTTAGDLRNDGVTLQGGTHTPGVVDAAGTASDGAVTLNVAGNLINTTTDDLAIIFGAGGDVSIRTGANVENARGRILANGDVRLVAVGDVLNLVDASPLAQNPTITQTTKPGERVWWTLWIKRKTHKGVTYDFGELTDPDKLATITATNGISITANALRNVGGQINANGGDLNITALRVETIGLGSGKVHVARICVITCSYEASGSVSYTGGSLNSSKAINITATESMTNTAGQIFAINDITLTTPSLTMTAALIPGYVKRPRGLYNFWASQTAWVYLRNQFGGVISDGGKITVKSAAPVRLVGGSFNTSGEIILENGSNIVRGPGDISGASGHTIGLYANMPFVSAQ